MAQIKKQEKLIEGLDIDDIENSSQPTTPVGDPTISRINLLTIVSYGILIVLFIGFAGMFVATTAILVDAFNNKTATYENLKDQVSNLNTKIDLLLNQNNIKNSIK